MNSKIPDTDPLKINFSEIDIILKRLDQLVTRHSIAIERLETQSLTSNISDKNISDSQFAGRTPFTLLDTYFLESGSRLGNANDERRNIDMASTYARLNPYPLRLSKGQIWAQAAAIISRAMKRNM